MTNQRMVCCGPSFKEEKNNRCERGRIFTKMLMIIISVGLDYGEAFFCLFGWFGLVFSLHFTYFFFPKFSVISMCTLVERKQNITSFWQVSRAGDSQPWESSSSAGSPHLPNTSLPPLDSRLRPQKQLQKLLSAFPHAAQLVLHITANHSQDRRKH